MLREQRIGVLLTLECNGRLTLEILYAVALVAYHQVWSWVEKRYP